MLCLWFDCIFTAIVRYWRVFRVVQDQTGRQVAPSKGKPFSRQRPVGTHGFLLYTPRMRVQISCDADSYKWASFKTENSRDEETARLEYRAVTTQWTSANPRLTSERRFAVDELIPCVDSTVVIGERAWNGEFQPCHQGEPLSTRYHSACKPGRQSS